MICKFGKILIKHLPKVPTATEYSHFPTACLCTVPIGYIDTFVDYEIDHCKQKKAAYCVTVITVTVTDRVCSSNKEQQQFFSHFVVARQLCITVIGA